MTHAHPEEPRPVFTLWFVLAAILLATAAIGIRPAIAAIEARCREVPQRTPPPTEPSEHGS